MKYMKNRLIKNKKGQGLNYFAGIVVLVLFGFFSILAYTVWQQMVVAFTAAGYNEGIIGATMDSFTQAFAANDYMIVLLFIVMIIAIALTSFKLATNTAFFIITLVFGFFWGMISYFFNFVFIQLVSPGVFSATIGVFPRTMILCTNLHWVMLIYIIIGSITLYGKEDKTKFLT